MRGRRGNRGSGIRRGKRKGEGKKRKKRRNQASRATVRDVDARVIFMYMYVRLTL